MIQLNVPLDDIIFSGTKKNSHLINLSCQFSENKNTLARMILKRIQTKKFRTYWESIPKLQLKSNKTVDDIPCYNATSLDRSQILFTARIPAKLLIDNKTLINTNRQWTQEIYKLLNQHNNPIQCMLIINRGEMRNNRLKAWGSCRHEKCERKFFIEGRLFTDNIELAFASKQEYLSYNHDDALIRPFSGERRNELAKMVIAHGAKQVSNQLIRSENLSSINCNNLEITKTMSSLRKMASENLAFADLSKDDSLDILMLKKITDNLPPSNEDQTPKFIKQIQLDHFLVSWGCETQMKIFLSNKDREVYLDATGNVTKSRSTPDETTSKHKRQFFYSMVFRDQSSDQTIPLFEFLSDKHNIATLSGVMLNFNREICKFSNNICPIYLVATEFSFALMS